MARTRRKKRRALESPPLQYLTIEDWYSGVVTALDDGRLPVGSLKYAENLWLDQDGIVGQRPGLTLYGPAPKGEILGELFPYKKQAFYLAAGYENWLGSLQKVNGEVGLYIARGEDSEWTRVGDRIYDSNARGHFIQTAGKVPVMNGEDTMSFLNIADATLTSFVKILDPATAPTLDKNEGLTGSTSRVFYAVTANSTIGQTKGSPVLTVQVSTDRDMWNKDTQYVRIKWTAVTGAKSYNIFCGVSSDGNAQPTLYRLAEGLSIDNLTFTDNGTRAINLLEPLPEYNSTAGPRVTRGTVVDGRPWFIGDKDNPYRVWYGGHTGHEMDLSAANGGGNLLVGDGTKEIPVVIKPYRDGPGNAKVTTLTKGDSGYGKRFLISESEISLGSFNMVAWGAKEDTGVDGTEAPDSAFIYDNNLFSLSRDGVKSTQSTPNLQGVLDTKRKSKSISTDLPSLSSVAMDIAMAIVHEGRGYFALAVDSNTNNQIWLLDFDRKGAWMKPWNIRADWMTLYDDNITGRTHHLIVQGDKIYELNKRTNTNDLGKAFLTSAMSGQIYFSKNGREWAGLKKVIYTILRPQGRINFQVIGYTEDGIQTFNQSYVFGAKSTRSGWSEPGAGWGKRGWGKRRKIPKSFNPPSEDVEVEVEEDVKWAQYGWSSTTSNVNYKISKVTFEYVNVGPKDLN